MEIGKEILKYRTENGLSLRAFAKMTGLSKQALFCFEHGTSQPNYQSLLKLIPFIGIGKIAACLEEAQNVN